MRRGPLPSAICPLYILLQECERMKVRINSHLLKTPTQHISHINRSRSRFCFQRTVETFCIKLKACLLSGLSGLRFCMFSSILRQGITLSCKVSPLQLSRINGSLTNNISIRFFRHKWLFTVGIRSNGGWQSQSKLHLFLHVIVEKGMDCSLVRESTHFT